jgi:hypothetical protein
MAAEPPRDEGRVAGNLFPHRPAGERRPARQSRLVRRVEETLLRALEPSLF